METISKNLEKMGIHGVLAYSYFVYLLAFILGVVGHVFLPGDYLHSSHPHIWGVILLTVGTVIIVWAQNTSAGTHQVREENKNTNITHHFKRGPYIISRSPTHIGLTLALVGFGFMINSIFIVALAILALIVTRSIFIEKQEVLLSHKYGESYKEYKKSVKL